MNHPDEGSSMARKIRPDIPRSATLVAWVDRPTSVPSPEEPCLGCGEETAVGSVFFSDRRTVGHADDRRTYLCSLCDSRIRSSRRGKPLTDEEVRKIVENGSAIATAWRP
jgi:hypothetical protein